jgi:DNA-binding response OmpR family regulator
MRRSEATQFDTKHSGLNRPRTGGIKTGGLAWILLKFHCNRGPFDIMNRKKILIVDDNEVIVRTLSLKLKANNYDVLSALDGAAAVSTARQQKPDLILLDITFPPEVSGVPWDGFQIIQWLHRLDEAKNIPIVIITGGDAAKYKDRALAEGAVAFFHKPVDNDELLATINKILSGAGGSTPA